MSDSILVALITGAITLFGTILTVLQTSKNTEKKLEIAIAVINKEIENLRKSVDRHNNFAERLPKLEQQVEDLAKQFD